MNIEEGNMNYDARGLAKLAASKGFVAKGGGGSHDLWKHPELGITVAIPRHKGSIAPGTVRGIIKTIEGKMSRPVREDEVIKPPERPNKIKLGANRTKVKWNPVKLKEFIINRIIKLVTETKADKIGTAYSQEQYNKAYSAPWSVLNDPEAPSSLKDLAYRVIVVQREGTEISYKNILNEKYVREMSPEEYQTHLKRKKDAKDWIANNKIHHDNIISHFDRATSTEREFGENWYHDIHEHAKHIASDTGVSMNQMAGLTATYSPQTHWGDNMTTAAKVARTKKAVGGRMQKIDDEGKSRGVMASAKQQVSAQRILNGEDYNTILKGHKVRAFGHLIEHGGDRDHTQPRVCVDRHALSVAIGKRVGDYELNESGIFGKKRYAEVEKCYIDAANKINQRPENVAKGYKIQPHQLQAVTWLTRQRLNSDEERATESAKNAELVAAGKPAKESKGSKTAKAGIAAMDRHDSYMGEFHPSIVGKRPGTGYSSVHEYCLSFEDEE